MTAFTPGVERLADIEATVRHLAHSMPPSDFGSTRVIQAVAALVHEREQSLAAVLTASQAHAAALEASNAGFREALAVAVKVANEAADLWDRAAPMDAKLGKLLLALAGHVPGYRVDTDAIHAALTTPPASAGPAAAVAADAIRQAERDRIIAALEEEAELTPDDEDAAVTRENALLIRADFSYEELDRLKGERSEPPVALPGEAGS